MTIQAIKMDGQGDPEIERVNASTGRTGAKGRWAA